MNAPTDTPTKTDIRPGEVRTYRGRTVEELIPRIRAELGPGAMILRERQGLTGGVGGFFAKRCVEIDAQAPPGLSVYADDEEALMPEPAAAQPTPDPFAGFAARLEQAAAAAAATTPAPVTPEPFAQTEPEAFNPTTPESFIPTTPESFTPTTPESFMPTAPASFMPPPPEPAPVSAPAPAPVPAPAPAPAVTPAPAATGFIAFDELEGDPEPERAPEPVPTAVFNTEPVEPEPVALTVPILLDVAPAAPGAGSVFRPRPFEADGSGQRPAFRPLSGPAPTIDDEPAAAPVGGAHVRERLISHGLSETLADQLVTAALKAAGSEEESLLTVAAQAALAAMLPQAAPLPLDGGVIAVVGPAGSGKTRAVAALAASCARAGHSVTVARVGGAGRYEELAELLEDERDVELVPAMKTKATVRAVAAARDEDLVILDTPSTTPGEDSAREALAETLARFSPDGVLLCAPATFTLRALLHLVDHHAGLQLDGLLATHADQAGMLGTVAELSIESRIPLGHVHAGLDPAGAISSVDPGALAADLVR